MDYHLSAEEMETVIRWDRATDTARVYTADSTVLTKIHKLAADPETEWKFLKSDKLNGRVISEDWECPKKLIAFRAKQFHSTMTEEQRKAAAERMKQIGLANKKNCS